MLWIAINSCGSLQGCIVTGNPLIKLKVARRGSKAVYYLGSFGFCLFSFTNEAPLTTRLLQPPSVSLFLPTARRFNAWWCFHAEKPVPSVDVGCLAVKMKNKETWNKN